MIPGYNILHRIHSGSKTQVYRAIDRSNNRPVIIKLPNDDYPIHERILRFRHQYTISHQLRHPQIIETIGIEPYQNSYALVLEDYGGVSLREWMDLADPSIESKLQIAIDLTLALHELVQRRIVHKDINPSNILIHPVTQQVKLIDFGIASLLSSETPEIRNPNVLEGTLAYIAPEQTGRMNRGIDYRCDFYSLGVTLFELFTEELPFYAEDAISWVHCHLTQIPVLVHEIDRDIPIVFSQIIAKLMAKNAEDRYQNAIGIKYDLDRCLAQWQAMGAVSEFAIGEHDLSDIFLIPQRLYGREVDVQTLLSAFDRVAQGSSELILVAGASGIGKTAVINEVHKPMTRRKGYFIKGKFDQFNRDIPLSAFVKAFRDLIEQLLSDTDLQLEVWKNEIPAALGENGQVLIDVIPKLERIIGKQSPVPKLAGTAGQNRFNWLFQKFIEVFTTPEHPLVLFLDDLQWADAASLQTIELLMKGKGYILVLGAYRDNEVTPAHPLMSMVRKLALAEQIVTTINLQPLTSDDIDRLVADTLHCPIDRAKTLTEVIALKTQGNPFFITQFLQALYTEGAITFIAPSSQGNVPTPPYGHPSEEGIYPRETLTPSPLQGEGWGGVNRGWECDMARVKALALTDDVVEFMAMQLQKLPLETQEMLKLAACIGNSFNLDTLAIVSEQSQSNTAAALWEALQVGLILPTSQIYKFFHSPTPQYPNTPTPPHSHSPTPTPSTLPTLPQSSPISIPYRFLHDRVQQAAYALIPAARRQQTHLYIGRLLLANTPAQQKSEQLFGIVNHLNIAIDLIVTKSEREVVARLNLAAAQRARAANAYDAAFHYAQIGAQLLGAVGWSEQYQLALELHENLAEAAYLSGKFQMVPALVQDVLDRAQTPIDRIKSYETIVEFHTLQKQYPQAIDRGLEILQQLGVNLPAQPSKMMLARELVKTKIALWGKSNKQLLNLPEINRPEQIAKLRILELLQDPAFFYSQELMLLLGLVGVQFTVRHGNNPWAASFYATYSICLASLDEFKQTERIGQLALTLAERFGDAAILAQVKLIVPLFCQPWRERFRDTIPMLDRSLDLAIESGNLSYIGTNAGMTIAARFYSGFCLDEVIDLIQQREELIVQSKNENSRQFFDLLWQTVQNLQQPSSQLIQIFGTDNNGELLIAQWGKTKEAYILSTMYSFQTLLAYLFDDIPTALGCADAQLIYEPARKNGYLITQIWMFDALTRLAAYPHSRQKRTLLNRVNYIQRQLLKRAQLMSGNFRHKYNLVAAEKCRVLGKFAQAMELYDRSIAGAKTNEYLQEEAIANELAAKFYLEWDKPKIAAVYMQEAYYCYTRWGATAKTKHLEQRYPQLLAPIMERRKVELDLPSSSEKNIADSISSQEITNFDLQSAIESAQALSNIIELPTLIDRLYDILKKNAGADTCILILPNHNQHELWQAYQINRGDGVLTTSCTPLAECDNLPLRLIDRVRDNREKIILVGGASPLENRDTTDPELLTDKYLALHQPQSAMCLPLIGRDQLQGIIYLENRHTADVFTPERQVSLEFIAAQAVITLQNAQLYESVAQRSAAMEASIDGMAILEHDRFIYLNPIYAKMYGYTVAELVNQPWQLLYDTASSIQIEQTTCPILNESGRWRGEAIATRKDGSTFDQELTLFLMGNGQIVSICRDISVQQAVIRSRQSQQDALTALGSWTAEGKCGNDFYRACTKYLAQTFDVQYALIGRSIDDNWDKCQIESCWTGTEFLAPFEMDLVGTPCLETYQNYWAIFPRDVLTHFPAATVLASLKAESYLSVAIRDSEGNIWGNLCIIDTKHLPPDISVFQFILQLFADRIAAEMIRHSQEDELRRSQQQLMAFIDNSSAVMYLKDLEGRYQLINQTCVDLSGGDADLYLGATDDAFYPPHIAAQIRANDLQVIQSGKSSTLEEVGLHIDGTEHTYISNKFVLKDENGKPYALGGVSTDITDLKQAEIALRQSEARYKCLADNIPGAIYQFRLELDGSTKFSYISSGCVDLFQLSPAAIIADANCLLQMMYPNNLAAFQQSIAQSPQQITPRSWESKAMLADGAIKWIKGVSRPALEADGSIVWDGVMLDITEQYHEREQRQRIAVDLATSQQKYYHLIQSVNGVVWEYDLNTDRFTFVSDRVVSLFGYPIADWLEQPNFWQNHIHPDDVDPTVRTYNEAIEYCYDCEFEYRMIAADGRVIWVYDISTLIRDADGKPISTTGLFIDINNLKQVEIDLHHTNEQLASTNTELQRATQLKDAFLATMSHELRTPLNAILGMSQVLQEQVFGNMNARQLKSISTIDRNGRHLLSLINDILDISKISAGKLELNITEISLKELCESSLIAIEQQALNKAIQVDISLPQDLTTIFVDERRIRQVLINLLTNAVKFTPDDGRVTLAVERSVGSVGSVGEQYHVCFSVTDTGIGIASADFRQLFQPFVQIDSTLNRKYEGSGLGLSIAKQIVELHGGIVSIDSTVGIGSCFTIELPQTARSSSSPLSSHTPLILLADHNIGTIDSYSSYLSAKGYQIILAQTGSEAISLSISDRPDLIIIDLQLPDVAGLDAISHIHQQPELAQIPIIALTAISIDGTREKCLAMGATEYMEKPVKLRELNQTIQECLKNSQVRE